MTKLKLSVFIIAHNEADRIAHTLQSVQELADDIVVIDSGSTDETASIAEVYGARVFGNPWPGYGMQKRFGEEQCRNHWLLNLDADESLTPEITAEIRALFAGGQPEEGLAGYILRIRDLLPGETKLAFMAHTNYVLRLYDKRLARFSDSPVHDSVQTEGKTRQLDAPVLHRSFRSLEHALEKMNSYTSAQAENLKKKGLPLATLRLAVEFPLAFLKGYFLRFYFLRGRRGFIYAMTYAYTRFARLAKYLECSQQTNH